MKNEQIIDNNPFCPICATKESYNIIHTNIKICEDCSKKLLKQIEEKI